MADQQPVQLNMDVDQVNNLQQQLQEDIGQPPPQQENAGQGQGGPPQPNKISISRTISISNKLNQYIPLGKIHVSMMYLLQEETLSSNKEVRK